MRSKSTAHAMWKQKNFIAGMRVLEPAANATKSVRLVSVMLTPAWRSARPMRLSGASVGSSRYVCSSAATMMYMSSTPSPSASSGMNCENGV